MGVILNRILCLAALVLVQSAVGCRDGGGTVRHGSLRYNAEEVFATKPHALELAKAAGRGDVDRVAELVASGYRVDEAGAEQITPLWWAAWIGNFQGFKALLEKGANPNIIKESGLSTMHLIARREDIRFLKAALKHKGDPNLPDPPEGDPPIREAVLQGMHEHIRTLLESGADPNYTNAISGRGLPELAISSGVGGYELALFYSERS